MGSEKKDGLEYVYLSPVPLDSDLSESDIQVILEMEDKHPKEMSGAFSTPFENLPYDFPLQWGTYHMNMFSWTAIADDPVEVFLGCWNTDKGRGMKGLHVVPSIAADMFESAESGSEEKREWETLIRTFPLVYDTRNNGLARIEFEGLHVPVFIVDDFPEDIADAVAVIIAAEEIIRIFDAVHNVIPLVHFSSMKNISKTLRISNFLDEFGYQFGLEMMEVLSFGRYNADVMMKRLEERHKEEDGSSSLFATFRKESTLRYVGHRAGVIPRNETSETLSKNTAGGRGSASEAALRDLYRVIGMARLWESIPDDVIYKTVDRYIGEWHGLGGDEKYPGARTVATDAVRFFSIVCDDLDQEYQISAKMDIMDDGIPIDVIIL